MASFPRPRGIIFDIDGTLVDSVDLHARAWQEALARFGVEVPFEAVRRQIGKGGDKLLPVFLPPSLLREKGAEIEAWRSARYKACYLPRVRPFPCVRELFQRVAAGGQKAALASSAHGEELAAYKRIARIDDLLAAETSTDDAERSKPDPDIFAAALDRLGLPPEAAVAVGDSPYDAEAAARLGLRCVGVLCGGFAETELRAAGCVEVYRGPAHLLGQYERSPLAP